MGALEMLREEKMRASPDANKIASFAMGLLESLEPLGEMDLPILTEGGPRTIPARDFLAVLAWLLRLKGPSPSRQTERYSTAALTDALINQLALKPPTAGSKSYEIAKVLHTHVFGPMEGRNLKRAVDAVSKSWQGLKPEARGR